MLTGQHPQTNTNRVTKLKENKIDIKAADENFQNIHLHILPQSEYNRLRKVQILES